MAKLEDIPTDADGWVLPNPNVDMDAYDKQLLEWGFEFEDDPDETEEPESDLTFLGTPE